MPTAIQTIDCPRCGQQLPVWSQVCQFCGVDLRNAPRPAGTITRAGYDNRLSWQEVCYIIVSILVTLNGAYDLAQGFNPIPNLAFKLGGGSFLGIMGTISVCLGIGLLFQQIWAQFIMKWYCVLAIVGLCGMGLMSIGSKGAMAYVAILLTLYGFMLYLIKAVGDVDP